MAVIEGQQERFTFRRRGMSQSYFRWKMVPIWERQAVLCRKAGDAAGEQRLRALIAVRLPLVIGGESGKSRTRRRTVKSLN